QLSPTSDLATITASMITAALREDEAEDIYYDFKEGMDSDDLNDIHRIRIAIASFANTFGGFLFFGILDKRNKLNRHGVDRVCGLTSTNELGRRITQKYLSRELCIPLVDFEGPRIVQVDKKSVAVVKILRSSIGPHAVKKGADLPLEFWWRGSGT